MGQANPAPTVGMYQKELSPLIIHKTIRVEMLFVSRMSLSARFFPYRRIYLREENISLCRRILDVRNV